MSQLKVVYRDLNAIKSNSDMRVPFNPPFNPSQFGQYAGYLLIVSFVLMSLFLINMVSPNKEERSLTKQLMYAALSSAFASFGFIFVILNGGLYI
jgi:hypothetical protein